MSGWRVFDESVEDAMTWWTRSRRYGWTRSRCYGLLFNQMASKCQRLGGFFTRLLDRHCVSIDLDFVQDKWSCSTTEQLLNALGMTYAAEFRSCYTIPFWPSLWTVYVWIWSVFETFGRAWPLVAIRVFLWGLIISHLNCRQSRALCSTVLLSLHGGMG